MLEDDEFEFYDYLDAYIEMFGKHPPTHDLEPQDALKLIKPAIHDKKEITQEDVDALLKLLRGL